MSSGILDKIEIAFDFFELNALGLKDLFILLYKIKGGLSFI